MLGAHGRGLSPYQQWYMGSCWLHGTDPEVESSSFKKGKAVTHTAHSRSSVTHFCGLDSTF